MTPKMEAALLAAADAGAEGLRWSGARWCGVDEEDRHGPVIVSQLVFEKNLAEAGTPGRKEGSRRIITEKGREYLIARRASVDPRPRP